MSTSGLAQAGYITTYAGSHAIAEGGIAINQRLRGVNDVLSDGAGGFYFSSSTLHSVYRVLADGTIRTIAGLGTSGFGGDGGQARLAKLNHPGGLARDSAGNLYIVDGENLRIRKVNSSGVISTVAGDGSRRGSFSGLGDGGPATSSPITPAVVAVDNAGNIYLSDIGRLRKVNTAGIISTIAGTGVSGFSGEGGAAILAQVSSIRGILVDGSGNIFISDLTNHRIRKIATDGTIVTLAGTGVEGFAGDNDLATSAQLNWPGGIALDNEGNLYIADTLNFRVRRVTPSGVINTIAGTGDTGSTGDNGQATLAHIGVTFGVATDLLGNLYLTGDSISVRKVNASGIIATVAGSGITYSGDGGLATAAQLGSPTDMAVDAAGNLYVADGQNQRVRKITPGGLITTVAGDGSTGFSGDGGPATAASLSAPHGLALDADGNLYISDVGNSRIRRVSTSGIISTVAGSGTVGYGGDGGPATSASFSNAARIAVDLQGNLYLVDAGNHRIRKITADGIIRTIAGTGVLGFSGDDGPAVEAQLNSPAAAALDARGNLYISDANNNRIRRVSPDGIIRTIAGGGTNLPFFNGQPATSARFGAFVSIAVDPAGNIFFGSICDVRKVDTAGILTRIAGSLCGFAGDDGPAVTALMGALPLFLYVAIDPTGGNLFIADPGNDRIRRIQLTQQVPYAIPNEGGMFSASPGTRPTLATGYGRLRPTAGSTPSGVAIYGFRSGNYLVSETGVPASRATTSGRIFAEVRDPVNTGLAIINPNNRVATVQFVYTDTQGNSVATGTFTIPPNSQLARFLSEAPFNIFDGPTFLGTVTITSDIPVSAIALRSLYNARRDFLMSTLPILDLRAPITSGVTVVPHFAAGGEWSTQLLLINPSDSPLAGTVECRDDNGNVIDILIPGQFTGNYSVAPRSAQKMTITTASLRTGSVRVVPAAGTLTPVPMVLFSYHPGGLTVSEAGVPTTQGTAFRLYAEASGVIETALAMANNGASTTDVMVELFRLDGTSTGLPAPVVLSLPPFGHTAKFLSQIFTGTAIPGGFKGTVRVSTTSGSGISVVELRTRYNERSDFLITTLPASDESVAPNLEEFFFPQIADGGNYSMQFILFNSRPGTSAGSLVLFSPDGGTLDISVQ